MADDNTIRADLSESVRYLAYMRLTIAVMQWGALAALTLLAPELVQHGPLIITLLYGLFTAVSWLRLRSNPPTHLWTLTLSLLADVLFLCAWLYPTGGPANPLSSLLLLPLAMGLIVLPMAHSLLIALVSVSLYTLLLAVAEPVSTLEASSVGFAHLHLLGTWGTFVVMAGILLSTVGSLVRRLRKKQQRLSQVREERLRDEQLIALGLSAANVAHRLGTPLNTMTLLVEDLKNASEARALQGDLEMLTHQLGICGDYLQQLRVAADKARAERPEPVPLNRWLQRLREATTLLWPGHSVTWPDVTEDASIEVDATLDQAVLNLIANALKASPEGVEIAAAVLGSRIEVTVRDHGAGLSKMMQESPGAQPADSHTGLGVGLFLSNATIQRLGGQLRATSSQLGTTMIIDLPRSHPNHD